MGCSSSRGVQVSQKSQNIDSKKSQNYINIDEPQSKFDQDFISITSSSGSICRIEDASPIVCLGDSSFPIVTSNLFLDSDNFTNISLPVVAVSQNGYGISIAIGHLHSLSEDKKRIGDSEFFYSSLFHWALSKCKKTNQVENSDESVQSFQAKSASSASSGTLYTDNNEGAYNSSKRVLSIGFPAEMQSDLKTFFHQFSLTLEFTSEKKLKSDFSKGNSDASTDNQTDAASESGADNCIANETFFNQYCMILTTSIVYFDKRAIQNYVMKGGIFTTFYIPPSVAKQVLPICLNVLQSQKRFSFANSNTNLEKCAFCVLSDNGDNISDFGATYAINDTLVQLGIAFTQCTLSVGEPGSSWFKVQPKYKLISNVNFHSGIQAYSSFINEMRGKSSDLVSPSDEQRLDDLVTNLRFYLAVINTSERSRLFFREVKMILEETCDFLHNSCPLFNPQLKQAASDKPFPIVAHRICFVLLVQILHSIPLEEFVRSPLMDANAGCIDDAKSASIGGAKSADQISKVKKHADQITGAKSFDIAHQKEHKPSASAISQKVQTVKLEVLAFSWTSTGLWLPRGAVAKLRCKAPHPYMFVQVGCQSTSLLEKSGPWKRFPVVVMSFQITQKEIEFSSPFGGIVYIAAGFIPNIDLAAGEFVTVKFEFVGLLRHPCAVMDQPDVWKEASEIDKNLLVSPWCELKSPRFIFTLPTDFLKRNEASIENYFQLLSELTEGIIKFTNCQPTKPFRVVFDVDVGDQEKCSSTYPLAFPLSFLQKIFTLEKPTKELFFLLKSFALISIREGSIDSVTEDAVSSIAACQAIKNRWKEFDPIALIENDPEFNSPIFKPLWDINVRSGQNAISSALSVFQDPNFVCLDTPEDMWMQFVSELCVAAKKNFVNTLKKYRPIPMNISNSIQGFPEC